MKDNYVFLFGANPSLEEPNKEFIRLAGGEGGKDCSTHLK